MLKYSLLLGDRSRAAQPVLRQGCTRTPWPEAVACPHATDTYEAKRNRRRDPIRAREGLCDQRRRVGGGTPVTGGSRGPIHRRDHCRGERQCIICTGSGNRSEQAFFSDPAIVRQKTCQLDELFTRFKPGGPWPSFKLTLPFMVTSPWLALQRNKWDQCGRVLTSTKVRFSADPKSKRQADGAGWSRPSETLESTPYSEGFGDELTASYEADGVLPDGPYKTQLQELLFG